MIEKMYDQRSRMLTVFIDYSENKIVWKECGFTHLMFEQEMVLVLRRSGMYDEMIECITMEYIWEKTLEENSVSGKSASCIICGKGRCEKCIIIIARLFCYANMIGRIRNLGIFYFSRMRRVFFFSPSFFIFLSCMFSKGVAWCFFKTRKDVFILFFICIKHARA